MKPISERYKYLYSEFYYEKARERFAKLVEYLDVYRDQIDFKQKLFTEVDLVKVDAFVTSYYLDVIRFKEYHFNAGGETEFSSARDIEIHGKKLLSKTKVGSFTTKWLLRYQPLVTVARDPSNLDENERTYLEFAPFAVALNFSLRAMDVKPRSLPLDLHRNIMYHLRFRSFDDRTFILYYDLLLQRLSNLEA